MASAWESSKYFCRFVIHTHQALKILNINCFFNLLRTVMSKPREFAHLIRTSGFRNKFGSADNISHIRAVESTSNSATTDEVLVSSPATTTLSAGNSNSLPGHSSQVILIILFSVSKQLTLNNNLY